MRADWMGRPVMVLRALVVVLFSAGEAGAVCQFTNCACSPSTVIADAILEPGGQLTLSNPLWADGGPARFDGGVFVSETDLVLATATPMRVVAGGGELGLDGGLGAGSFLFRVFAIDDGGATATCGSTSAAIGAWKDALRTGTCAQLAPTPPCNDTRGRGCSTSGEFCVVIAAVAALARRRSRG